MSGRDQRTGPVNGLVTINPVERKDVGEKEVAYASELGIRLDLFNSSRLKSEPSPAKRHSCDHLQKWGRTGERKLLVVRKTRAHLFGHLYQGRERLDDIVEQRLRHLIA